MIKNIHMSFKKFLGYVSSPFSSKEDILDVLLDKINSGEKLTTKEKEFMDHYEETKDSDVKDFMLLDKQLVIEKLDGLISKNKTVICDLTDKDGKIGLPIIEIDHIVGDDFCYLILKHGEKVILRDNFLYNLIYNVSKGEYSLQSQDEYYEKLSIKEI